VAGADVGHCFASRDVLRARVLIPGQPTRFSHRESSRFDRADHSFQVFRRPSPEAAFVFESIHAAGCQSQTSPLRNACGSTGDGDALGRASVRGVSGTWRRRRTTRFTDAYFLFNMLNARWRARVTPLVERLELPLPAEGQGWVRGHMDRLQKARRYPRPLPAVVNGFGWQSSMICLRTVLFGESGLLDIGE
jgi:hypothetical protein